MNVNDKDNAKGNAKAELNYWACEDSPTGVFKEGEFIGAHHWLIDSKGLGECKYCGAVKQHDAVGPMDK